MSSPIFLPILAILAGFAGLIWSADRFVAGAASFAQNLGMSTLMIGLTIVSLGTSAPEVLVAINASIEGSGQLAMGNAIGSNLANIGLVLAVTALIAPIPITRDIFKMEIPFLIALTALLGLLIFNGVLTFVDSIVLILCIPLFLWLVAKTNTHSQEDDIEEFSNAKAFVLFLGGLLLLIISSDVLVWGAKGIAESLGVSELIIGLTIVAVGTSLPELAASIASVIKGHHDIALGNVIGSNIFNIMAVASVPGLFAPLAISSEMMYRDYLSMAALTLLLIALCAISLKRQTPKLGRSVGVLLLTLYLAYYYLLMQ